MNDKAFAHRHTHLNVNHIADVAGHQLQVVYVESGI